MKLFFRESGQGTPLIILHGLFGSSDNWVTVAKSFATQSRVFLVDQRNHGQSPHSDEMNYQLLAEDLSEFVLEHKLTNAIVIGHSMGGKTAMNFAVKYPDQLDKLVVVDIIPKFYPIHHDLLVAGMKSLPLDQLASRTEADEKLAVNVPDADERQFLLKNLVRKSTGGFQWKVNLPAIDTHLADISEGMQFRGQFARPTLFVLGSRSRYFKTGDEGAIRTIFPNATLKFLDTGHWVQAEKPAEFVQTVVEFLGN